MFSNKNIEKGHSFGYVHLDLKPANILMEIDPDEDNLFQSLIIADFGLSQKFVDSRGNHDPYYFTNKAIGTLKFCSVNSLKGLKLTRRDDLISVLYILVYLSTKQLPWSDLGLKNRPVKKKE